MARRCRAKSRPVFDRPGLQGVLCSVLRDYSAGGFALRAAVANASGVQCGSALVTRNLPQDGATDGVREANQSHVFDSPVPGEGRSPNGPGDEEDAATTALAKAIAEMFG